MLNKHSERENTMAKFGYQTIREMDPRPGVKYATKYYKQHTVDKQKLLAHTENCAKFVYQNSFDQDLHHAFKQKIDRRHRRQDGTYYNTYDVIIDALEQLQSGKDMPESMITRWNARFGETKYSIEMVLESDMPAHNLLDELFS